ncbi:MAG: nucleoside deaminase [Lysobacteraceae bacterium]
MAHTTIGDNSSAAIRIALPGWVENFVDSDARFVDDDAKIELAIALSQTNIAHATGGPFGAAIFDGDGRVLGLGVNCVIAQGCSVAHAEMMAFMAAQMQTGRHRLNDGTSGITLATSAQPCCMCYGASVWAGIDRLLIGARAEDVMALTAFDEGPLPADWIGELERRGITVRRDLQREAACAVLRTFGKGRGDHY